MSHGIEIENGDLIITAEEFELSWHKLDLLVKEITEETAAPVLNPIVELEAPTIDFRSAKVIDGTPDLERMSAAMERRKVIASWLGHRSPELQAQITGGLTVIHSVPTTVYGTVSNRRTFQLAMRAIVESGLKGKVSSVGTLKGSQIFFMGINIPDFETFKVAGETWKANLVLVNYHDGRSLQAHETIIRPVCQNTVNAGLADAANSEVNFRVVHKGNVEEKLLDLEGKVTEILERRAKLIEHWNAMTGVSVTEDQAMHLYADFIGGEDENLSTNSYNRVVGDGRESLTHLFRKGQGNEGMFNLLAVFHGFTEFFTSGNGVGKKSDRGTAWFKANYGEAAKEKSRFLGRCVELLNDETRETALQNGERLVKAYDSNERAKANVGVN